MKKIFSAIALLLAFASCAGGGSDYTISGVIDGAIDGDSVQLGYSMDGINFTTVQATTIEGGKFQFSGKVDGSKIYYIGYNYTDPPLYSLLFLEGGNITTEISPAGSATVGTPSNDLNAEIEEHLAQYVNTIYDCQMLLYSDTLLPDTTKAALSLRTMEAQRDASLYIKDIINNNISSIVGLYLLVQYADLFDNNEFDILMASIPQENIDRDNNCLYDILCEMQSERRTQPLNEETPEQQIEQALEQALQGAMDTASEE